MKIKMNTENMIATLLFLFLIVYPLMTSAYKVLNLASFLSMVFISLSVALIWGYAGIFSSGQSLFFGIGGYFYGILMLNVTQPSFTLVAFILGVVVAGLVSWLLGYIIFYGGVNDMFVGLITLCVTLAIETFMAQTAGPEWKIGNVSLGGYNGINSIPTISIGSFSLVGNNLYYFILILLLVVYISLRLLVVSRWGYALIAIRENRERSKMFGYNVPFIQTMVFALGGALASLSGILYACWGGYMTPSTMSLSAATLPVVLVAAGGRKNLTAGMIFTLIYLWFAQYLSANGNQYALVILGLLLLVVILLLPQGMLVALFNWLDSLKLRPKARASYEINPVKEVLHEK
ncbi:branched-chain amino acid ABC transporter permease [Paenibacillus solisilvae]|uniref:Branched-chain amino acid ABC transporter permease n=1 Tax=Paenibacillus solisilvae TaxID=2486751 RepID=A0ABW0W4V0_9BACL